MFAGELSIFNGARKLVKHGRRTIRIKIIPQFPFDLPARKFVDTRLQGAAEERIADNRDMLRDKNLVPLSRQHQHALALCVRINRAALSSPEELQAWQAEIQQHFEQEIQYHFAAEEADLFPIARRYPQLAGIVEELICEHAVLRDYFGKAAARNLDQVGLRQFGETLSAHIRKEERQLFEGIQECLNPEELMKTGLALDRTLASASQTCIVPTEATLRKAKADR